MTVDWSPYDDLLTAVRNNPEAFYAAETPDDLRQAIADLGDVWGRGSWDDLAERLGAVGDDDRLFAVLRPALIAVQEEAGYFSITPQSGPAYQALAREGEWYEVEAPPVEQQSEPRCFDYTMQQYWDGPSRSYLPGTPRPGIDRRMLPGGENTELVDQDLLDDLRRTFFDHGFRRVFDKATTRWSATQQRPRPGDKRATTADDTRIGWKADFEVVTAAMVRQHEAARQPAPAARPTVEQLRRALATADLFVMLDWPGKKTARFTTTGDRMAHDALTAVIRSAGYDLGAAFAELTAAAKTGSVSLSRHRGAEVGLGVAVEGHPKWKFMAGISQVELDRANRRELDVLWSGKGRLEEKFARFDSAVVFGQVHIRELAGVLRVFRALYPEGVYREGTVRRSTSLGRAGFKTDGDEVVVAALKKIAKAAGHRVLG